MIAHDRKIVGITDAIVDDRCQYLKPSFHMIAHDRRIVEMLSAIVSDYMETLFTDRTIVSYCCGIDYNRSIAEMCFHAIADG